MKKKQEPAPRKQPFVTKAGMFTKVTTSLFSLGPKCATTNPTGYEYGLVGRC